MDLITVARLLESGRPAAAPVARRGGAVLSFGDLQRDVAALLPVLARHGRGRWLVSCEDSYAFAVAILAVWHGGSIVVLPPNSQPETLADIAAGTCGLLTDRPAAIDVPVVMALGHPAAAAAAAAPSPRWTPIRAAGPHLELYTSGTTGARKLVTKDLEQLDAELSVLEQTFGPALKDATVAASVTHQHIYGLLFRVLWPLLAGRPFVAETLLHPPELLRAMADVPRWALISSPLHLKRMLELVRLEGWTDRCCFVTSSGGPLDVSTAHAWADALGEPPLEVLGSTETGGIAWRRQRPGRADTDADAGIEIGADTGWTPLSGVEVSVDPDEELLAVRSPFAGAAAAAGVHTGDRARLLRDGRFLLLGRADRIVKVGGKRLSLAEMEQRLTQHPGVAEAALVQLDAERQGRIVAVLVLDEAGRASVARLGRRAFHDTLRAHLLGTFDLVTIPRVWRHVDSLPVDPTGKVTVPALRELFAVGASGGAGGGRHVGGRPADARDGEAVE